MQEATRRRLDYLMLRIVAIEDNTADTQLLREALQLSTSDFTLTTFEDAESAVAYLVKARAETSHLIVLDLKLPGRRSGLELLREIKADKDLRNIPVIVVAGSEDPDDVRSAYALHASCYLVKRGSAAEQLNALRMMVDFWITTARLPWYRSTE